MHDPHEADVVDDTPQASFAAELQRLRKQAGLSVRALAHELHRAHSGIVEYERAQRLPTVEVVEQYEDFFGLTRGTLAALRERARAAEVESPRDGSVDEHLGNVVCPYKGLRAFEVDDAALFFGRERQAEDVLKRLAEVRFAAVVGASGSGKSSFVRAALLAQIKAGAGDGAVGARVALLTPGAHPLDALARAVNAATGHAAGGVSGDDLRADPDALRCQTGQAGAGAVVIAVDQLEELFTLSHDEGERRCFVDALIGAWQDPASPVAVILALRADFYGRVSSYPQLAAAVVAHQTLIGPMNVINLRRAIELPASQTDLLLQPGLVDTILQDVGDAPGALPLLSHALLETCKRRRRLMLTVSGYREAGGVHGAIAQSAEHTLQALPEADRAIARVIFLSLTDVSERTEPTRRRVDRTQLTGHPQSAAIDRVLNVLADARLVSLEENTVVIAHEALIGHWPRLRGWIDTDRAGLLIHRRLIDAAREWDVLKREPAALYRGARLTAAREWATDHPDHLSALERDFLAASEATERSELEAATHRSRRLRVLAASLAALTVIVATLAAWALGQRSTAQRQATAATSLALAATSSSLLTTRPDIALLLAFEAYHTSPRTEGRSAVLAALTYARKSRVLAILHGHTDAVSSVAFGPDRRTLASASNDRTVRLWDARTHKQIGAPLIGHSDVVEGVAFSPDGRTVASTSDDRTVRLWDARTHKQLGAPLTGHGDVIYGVAFSPDGRTLASTSDDRTVRLWDARTHKQLGAPITGHTAEVVGVAFSPDRRTLASASIDRTVRLWDARTHKQLGAPLTGHTHWVVAVAFSPDGRTLASTSKDRTIRLWDARTHKQLGAPLIGHTDTVGNVAFSPNARRLASSSTDRTVRLWNVRTHKQIGAPLNGHTSPVVGVAFSPDGRTLASASFDKTVRLWDARFPKQQNAPLSGHTNVVVGVTFSPDGRTLASASYDKAVRLWDARTRQQIGMSLTGHTARVNGVAFSPDGRTLASASNDRTVRLWDARTRKQIGAPLIGHSDVVEGVAFSPDGRTLASSSTDRTLRLWDTRTHKQLDRPLIGHSDVIYGVAFSPDGRKLASASREQDGPIRLWDTRTHKQLGRPLTGHVSPVFKVAFSPDGRTLASAAADRTVRLWDVRTHKQLGGALIGHTAWVYGVAFSPDGRTLASASKDRTVRLWDVDTHTQLGRPLTGHTAPVVGVAFSPDGRTLTSASKDRTIRLWNNLLWRDLAQLRITVCNLVGGGLSKTEWAHYAPGIPYRQSCS
jgi:WD40 repeat protein/transcriptional regulator with XRE-family HTH domain